MVASAWGSPLLYTRHGRTVRLQEAHDEADPAAPEPTTAEVAPAEVPPAADKDELVAEVTPAAVDSTAAAGEPIAEAVVALQEVMEPAPVPEPVLEGKSSGGHASCVSDRSCHSCKALRGMTLEENWAWVRSITGQRSLFKAEACKLHWLTGMLTRRGRSEGGGACGGNSSGY